LLLDIMLGTTLLGLSNIMLLLRSQLCVTVSGDTSDRTSDGTSNTVSNTRAKITKLTLGFLALSFGVLLGSLALEVLSKQLDSVHVKRG
jgi:hypothetical protein